MDLAAAHEFLLENKFDIIHAHTISGSLFAPLRKAPTVVTTHIRAEELRGMYSALDDYIKLIAISNRQRSLSPNLNWFDTIYHSVKLEEFSFSARSSDRAVAIGRFHPEKGFHNAINICRKAGIPLVIVGRLIKQEEKEYFTKTIEPLLDKDIKVVFNAPRGQIIEILQKAYCLIHAVEVEEAFGLVMVEAMSCGTPVLGLRRGAIPEIVAEGVTGWVRDTPDHLVELISQVKKLDRAACRKHASTFSTEVMAGRYEEAYRSVLT